MIAVFLAKKADQVKNKELLPGRLPHGGAKALLPQMVNKLKQFIRTKHKISYQFAYKLQHIETNELLVYYKTKNSPWVSK